MIVYKATNIINKKSYIGQTKRKKFTKHWWRHLTGAFKEKNSTKVFHRAIRKYGPENFIWEVLEYCDSKEEMDDMETHYIYQYRTYIHWENSQGYNMTLGGDGGYGSRCNVGRKLSEEHKEKISKANKGRIKSEEEKKEIGLRMKGNKYNVGKKHNKEVREKISKALTGRKTEYNEIFI